MSKQFDTKADFDKWVVDFKNAHMKSHGDSLLEWFTAPDLTEEDYINGLIADGYTDLDNLVADGHAYQIGNHTNNGWYYRDEVDMERVSDSVEIRER